MRLFLRRYTALGETITPELSIRPALRINTLKINERQLLPRLKKENVQLTKIPFLQYGYWYEAPFSLGATPEYLLGYYYLQEAAAQLPVQVLSPEKDDVVLDMTASPGGKTTQLAQLMHNQGTIIALDNNTARLESLRNNLERCGVTNTLVYKKDARFVTDLNVQFDKILLDAPCSGNYCINPNYFSEKTIPGIKERARLQKSLLKAAHAVLKKGGTLVYSTCSLEPEENELVINWFLQKYSDMKTVDTGLSIGDAGLTTVFDEELNPNIKKTRRFWPHKTGTEGFFIAKLVK